MATRRFKRTSILILAIVAWIAAGNPESIARTAGPIAGALVLAESGCVPEICDNGIDDDCDGLIDTADPDCSPCPFTCGFDNCPPATLCNEVGCCVPYCGDGVKNGDEGDVDCGGSCDAKCCAGKTCWGNFDCINGVCLSGICQAAIGQPADPAGLQVSADVFFDRLLSWSASCATIVEGYNVYRTSSVYWPDRAQPPMQWFRLNGSLVGATSLVDAAPDQTDELLLLYYVTAVDSAGNESPPPPIAAPGAPAAGSADSTR